MAKSMKFDMTGMPDELVISNSDWIMDDETRAEELALHDAIMENALKKQLDRDVLEAMLELWSPVPNASLVIQPGFRGWVAPDGTLIQMPPELDAYAATLLLIDRVQPEATEAERAHFFETLLGLGFAAVAVGTSIGILMYATAPAATRRGVAEVIATQPLFRIRIDLADEGRRLDTVPEFEKVLDVEVFDFPSDRVKYTNELTRIVRERWMGGLDLASFETELRTTVELGLERSWATGLRDCGINPDEATEAEREILRNEIVEASNAFAGFADWLGAQVENENVGFDSARVRQRINIWANRYRSVYHAAKAMACGDKKFKWVYDPEKEHCADCAKLHGRVYRASVWAKYGIHPQHPDLECGGWLCGCRFEETDEPAWPGFPPKLSGG